MWRGTASGEASKWSALSLNSCPRAHHGAPTWELSLSHNHSRWFTPGRVAVDSHLGMAAGFLASCRALWSPSPRWVSPCWPVTGYLRPQIDMSLFAFVPNESERFIRTKRCCPPKVNVSSGQNAVVPQKGHQEVLSPFQFEVVNTL